MDQLSKKESKIRKDDKKSKEPAKKEATKGKVAEEKEVSIQMLDTKSSINFDATEANTLLDISADHPKNFSIYVSFLEDFLKAGLRLV